MHEYAEYGGGAHWVYKSVGPGPAGGDEATLEPGSVKAGVPVVRIAG